MRGGAAARAPLAIESGAEREQLALQAVEARALLALPPVLQTEQHPRSRQEREQEQDQQGDQASHGRAAAILHFGCRATGRAQPAVATVRCATHSISTAASRASAATPIVALAGGAWPKNGIHASFISANLVMSVR